MQENIRRHSQRHEWINKTNKNIHKTIPKRRTVTPSRIPSVGERGRGTEKNEKEAVRRVKLQAVWRMKSEVVRRGKKKQRRKRQANGERWDGMGRGINERKKRGEKMGWGDKERGKSEKKKGGKREERQSDGPQATVPKAAFRPERHKKGGETDKHLARWADGGETRGWRSSDVRRIIAGWPSLSLSPLFPSSRSYPLRPTLPFSLPPFPHLSTSGSHPLCFNEGKLQLLP